MGGGDWRRAGGRAWGLCARRLVSGLREVDARERRGKLVLRARIAIRTAVSFSPRGGAAGKRALALWEPERAQGGFSVQAKYI